MLDSKGTRGSSPGFNVLPGKSPDPTAASAAVHELAHEAEQLEVAAKTRKRRGLDVDDRPAPGKLFEDGRLYTSALARARLGQLSDRAFQVLVRAEGVPRVALTTRSVMFRGADLNALVERALARGRTFGPVTGAALKNCESARRKGGAR